LGVEEISLYFSRLEKAMGTIAAIICSKKIDSPVW